MTDGPHVPPGPVTTAPERRGRTRPVELREFLHQVNRGALIEGGSRHHRFMHGAAQDALRIVARMNTGHRTPREVRELLAELTGKPVDDTVAVFPPFYSEFGKNLTLGHGRLHQPRLPLQGHRPPTVARTWCRRRP